MDEAMAELRAQYWRALAAKNAADEEMAALNQLIIAEKARRGDLGPEDELELWPKKPQGGA